MNETLLYPWKPTPEDEKYRVAYNLINSINFSLQRITAEQKHINDILNNSSQSAAEIVNSMGNDGEVWMKAYNESVLFVERLVTLTNKTLTDISANEIKATTANLEVVKEGIIRTKPIYNVGDNYTITEFGSIEVNGIYRWNGSLLENDKPVYVLDSGKINLIFNGKEWQIQELIGDPAVLKVYYKNSFVDIIDSSWKILEGKLPIGLIKLTR